MNEWNIQSRAHACQMCERTFTDKEIYHTLLFEAKSDLLRQDICPACWQSQHCEGAKDRKGFVSHWQGIYEAPPPAPPEPIQKETAETLLRKLIEMNDPAHGPAAYILAVMLERKRLLKVKEQLRREGQRIFIYEQPRTGDLFTITDPNLQLNQLEQVQHDVAQLLEHGLTTPTPAEPAVAPNSEGALLEETPAAIEQSPEAAPEANSETPASEKPEETSPPPEPAAPASEQATADLTEAETGKTDHNPPPN